MNQHSDNRIGRFILSFLLIALSVAWLYLFIGTTTPVESAPLLQSTATPISTATAYPTATNTSTPTMTLTPSNTPTITNTPITPVPTVLYSDSFEPNNTLADSYSIVPDETATCGSTLWPSGDEDYFRFYAREGFSYSVLTSNLSAGIDTTIKLYDPSGRSFTNDEGAISRTSDITFVALESGYFYARVKNQDGSDPAGKTYCVEVNEIQPTVTPTTTTMPTATGTVTPTSTPSFTVDTCEVDDTLTDACLMGRNETKSNMNFVPNNSWKDDRDWYALYVTRGIQYTCETTNLSSVADTVINMYARDGNPLFIGNDNRALGDFSSEAVWIPNYTGWIYILVESAVPVAYEESSRYTYDFTCSFAAPTATPTPTETPVPTQTPIPTQTLAPTATFAPTTTPLPTATPRPTEPPLPTATARPNLPTATRVPTRRPLPTATARPVLPTSTPIELNGYDTQPNATETPVEIAIAQLPTNTPQPPKSQIQFSALPTPTPQSASAQDILNLTVTLYYDENSNYEPEINEGIMDVSVALYDSISGQLLAFGYTNEAGIVPFEDVRASGAIRLSIPFLSYTQVLAAGTNSAEIRIAPQPRPSELP